VGAPQHSGLEEQQPRLPFPAKVLSVFVVAVAARGAVSVAVGVRFGGPTFGHGPLDTATVASSILAAALFAPSAVGLLLRRAFARRVLLVSWWAVYGTEALLRSCTAFCFSLPLRYGLLGVWHFVIRQAIVAVLVTGYLRSRPVRQATGESPATRDAAEHAPQNARRLPFVGKILAVLVFATGVERSALSVFMFADIISRGFWGAGTPWFSLLWQPGVAWPVVCALMGVAGIVGGAVLLCRQSWGRWTVLVLLCFDVLYIGALLSVGALYGRRYGAVGQRVLWGSGAGAALAVLYTVFLIGILCTRGVRDAMVARR